MLSSRRCKIVATIGPATCEEESLKKAILAGMNVARLNFSHGNHEDHLKVLTIIRRLSKDLLAPVTIMQDLQGPKIRVGKFKNGSIELKPREIVTITIEDVLGGPGLIPSDFKEIVLCCKTGTRVLLDDGLLELCVLEVLEKEIKAQVIYGGILKDRKGMNLPGVALPVEGLTAKDVKDLEFGLAHGVDYVALSFVRQARDVRRVREIIEARKGLTKICAKIEMVEAIENLEDIVRLSDAVMVARGDLTVEVGHSRLPGLQKRIISLCNKLGKSVITATQMLDSMTENPRPTRAEITDVANAVLDGSDGVMLSAETASGKYPFRCIRTMHEIITEVERNEEEYYKISIENEFFSIPAAIGASSSLSALKLNAAAIVCLTTTGKTAQIIAGFRPKARIIAVTNQLDVLNRLEIIWGLQTLLIDSYDSIDNVINQVDQLLVNFGLVKTGEKVILTLGHPIEVGSKTNALIVHQIVSERQENSTLVLPLRCQEISPID